MGEFKWENEVEMVKDELVDEEILSGYSNKTHSYQCNLCNKLMPNKSVEDKKKIQYHLNIVIGNAIEKRIKCKKSDTRDLSELFCRICFKKAKSWKGKCFKSRVMLKSHQQIHSDVLS